MDRPLLSFYRAAIWFWMPRPVFLVLLWKIRGEIHPTNGKWIRASERLSKCVNKCVRQLLINVIKENTAKEKQKIYLVHTKQKAHTKNDKLNDSNFPDIFVHRFMFRVLSPFSVCVCVCGVSLGPIKNEIESELECKLDIVHLESGISLWKLKIFPTFFYFVLNRKLFALRN